MKITLKDGTTLDVLSIFGGTEHYQNAQREYLEITVPQEGHVVEELETLMTPENCAAITITDDNDEQFIHEGYVIRGAVRVYPDAKDGTWRIAIKRYQQTELERQVAELQAAVAALQAKK